MPFVSPCPLFNVLEPLGKQAHDVLIIEGVEDLLTGAPWPNQSHPPKESELVGDGRLRQAEKQGDIPYTEFGTVNRVEDADAGGIAERLECLSKRFDRSAVQ